MHILFVVEHFPAFSETFVLNQVTGLIDRGHEVEVYALGKPVTPVMHEDFETYHLHERTWIKPEIPAGKAHRILCFLKALPRCLANFPRATMASLNFFRHGRQAANLYLFFSLLPFLDHKRDFDIVHCHFGDKGTLAQLWRDWGIFKSPISVVFHAHEMAGLSIEQGRALYGRLFESNALLLPVTEYWRQYLLDWGANPQRTLVHRMGVDLRRFEQQQLNINIGHPIRLLSVSRLTEMKGTEYAIHAVANLRPRYSQLRYTIVGDGPLRDDLETLIEQLQVGDCVELVGPQPQEKVAELLRSAHIYLVPSVTDSIGYKEGLPVALMEALAVGVPTVATTHAGIPELVTDNVSGLLVEERDVEGLARAIEKLITNPELYSAIAKQGHERVERDFNIQPLNARLEQLFMNESKA